MKTLLLLTTLAVFSSCAASPKKIQEVAVREVERLDMPSVPLSAYSSFEFSSMTYSEEVLADPKKVKKADELRMKIEQQIAPLLDDWNRSSGAGNRGALDIRAELRGLRIVSGGSRFWAGAFAGDSNIDLDLILEEKGTRREVAKVRVDLEADAFAGGWSVGKSDSNLMVYVASIVREYLQQAYGASGANSASGG